MVEGKPADYRQWSRDIDSDEIDLIELFRGLWQQKALILIFTLVALISAAAFVFLSHPEYEAKAGVLPPQLSDIAGYNLGRSEVKLSQFSVSDVYAVFKADLLSESLKRSFFRDVYVPSLAEDKRSGAQDKLWMEFNDEVLTVKASDVKNRPGFYEVIILNESSELAAKWANQYVVMAAERTERGMQENVLTEIAARVKVLEGKIDALRTTAKKRREDRIVRLREALVVAEAVGMDAPQVVAGKISSDGDLAQFIDGNLMYMRGAKAIRAELSVLEKRENDDPFIDELRGLENQLSFLSLLRIDPENTSVVTLDGSAEVPETPVKPKKAIILVSSILVGGMLGVFIALIRIMWGARRIQSG
tara:strand:+ start:507 stop:1589 length:1083 start_codon:yes stop_codon:yes gene_type:complete